MYDQRQTEIVPEPENCFDQGIWCPLSKILEKNIKDSIECFTDIQEPPDILHAKVNCGFDGNGQNAYFRSCKNGTGFILGGCRIISIFDEEENVLYN